MAPFFCDAAVVAAAVPVVARVVAGVVAAALPVVVVAPAARGVLVWLCKGAVAWPAICDEIAGEKVPVISLRLSKESKRASA